MEKKILQRWRELIANSDTEIAINEINKSGTTNEIIIIKNRWQELKAERIKGTISQTDYELERNKINSSILELIHQIEVGNGFKSFGKIHSLLNAKTIAMIVVVTFLSIGIGYLVGESNTPEEIIITHPLSEDADSNKHDNATYSAILEKKIKQSLQCNSDIKRGSNVISVEINEMNIEKDTTIIYYKGRYYAKNYSVRYKGRIMGKFDIAGYQLITLKFNHRYTGGWKKIANDCL